MSKLPDESLSSELRERAAAGASLRELLDLVHERMGVPKYNRGVVMAAFGAAFELGPLDFTNLLFACEIFDDGASVSLEETERLFRERLRRKT
jgi:hypothetical protein